MCAFITKGGVARFSRYRCMNDPGGGHEQFQFRVETPEFTASPKRQAILVLGMHRSATSAVGGVISARGVAGPKTLLPPSDSNPRGFFESAPLYAALDKMLASAGSAWDDWRELDPQWFHL